MESIKTFKLTDDLSILMDQFQKLYFKKGENILETSHPKSLLLILPFFEKDYNTESLKEQFIPYQIAELIPFDRLISFLITEMQSPYWIELVLNFIISHSLVNNLSESTLKTISNELERKIYPQKIRHLFIKILRKAK
jgi:hypothetical protein